MAKTKTRASRGANATGSAMWSLSTRAERRGAVSHPRHPHPRCARQLAPVAGAQAPQRAGTRKAIVNASFSIRDATPDDFAAWKPLWDGYNSFYGRHGPTALPEVITQTTWQRF